jgi:hypothetical protein
MLTAFAPRRFARFARFVLAFFGLSLALAGLQRPSAALPRPGTCSASWAAAVSGSWFDPARWSTGAVPGQSDDVCVTVDGTYTVAIDADSARARSVVLGAAGNSGIQMLAIRADSCVGNAQLSTTGPITVRPSGDMSLSGSDGNCGPRYGLVGSGDVITNGGVIETEPAGGMTYVDGNLANDGTLAIDSPDSVLEVPGTTLTNTGSVATGTGGGLRVQSGITFVNGSGGAISNGGSLAMQSGSTFNQGDGTASGNPVVMAGGTLDFTGNGTASFRVPGGNGPTVSGHMAAGQRLSIEADSCLGHALVVAAPGFASAGTIALVTADGTCGPKDALLDSDDVIRNTGTIRTSGAGGTALLNAGLSNAGSFQSGAFHTDYDVTGYVMKNSGTVKVSNGSALRVLYGADFTNTAGTVSNAGTLTVQTGSTFTQGAGSVTGDPVALDGGSLKVTGKGSGSFLVTGGNTTTVAGSMAPHQALTVQASSCGGDAQATAAAGFTNGGTITLRGDDGDCGGAFALLGGASFSNTGTLRTGGKGTTYIQAGVSNSGTVVIGSPDSLFDSAGTTLMNAGIVLVAAGGRLGVRKGATFANDAGGSIANSGAFSVLGDGTFTQGAGTAGKNAIQIAGGTLTFTGSGAARFVVPGGNGATVGGDLAPGQWLTVKADSCKGDARATASAAFTSGGTIQLDGDDGSCGTADAQLLLPSGATLTNVGNLDADSGGGAGTRLAGSLDNRGVVRVLRGTVLAVSGGYRQEPEGTLDVSLAAPDSFGQLAAGGTTTLDGALVVRTSFDPPPGQTFLILTFPSRHGTFASKRFHGHAYKVEYHSTDVTLVAKAGLSFDRAEDRPSVGLQARPL